MVVENWRNFVQRLQQDLIVRVREHLPLRTPVMEEGDIVLPLHQSSSTTQIGDPVIAAAARASANAEIDSHMLCFCYCDSPDMELVRLTCCKQMIHRQCVLVYLSINSQCVYCKSVLDMAGVLELTTIDRLEMILPATMSPTQWTPTTQVRSGTSNRWCWTRLHFDLPTMFGQNHRIRSVKTNMSRRKR